MLARPLKLNISLDHNDWDDRLGGWNCDALNIPGAEVESIYYDRRKADKADFYIENSDIRWRGDSTPRNVLVRISLTEDLKELGERKKELEEEKIELEKEKFASDKKWKKRMAVITIACSMFTALVTYLTKQPSPCNQITTNALSKQVEPKEVISSPIPPTKPSLSAFEAVRDYYNSLSNGSYKEVWENKLSAFYRKKIDNNYDEWVYFTKRDLRKTDISNIDPEPVLDESVSYSSARVAVPYGAGTEYVQLVLNDKGDWLVHGECKTQNAD